MTRDDIATRLAWYTPKSLDATAWTAARAEVIAAVLAAEPSSEQRAIQMASAVAGFLNAHPAWDRSSTPMLREWLTRGAVDAHASRVASGSKARHLRSELRAVANALAPDSIKSRTYRPAEVNQRFAAFINAAGDGSPFTALAAACQAQGIRFDALGLRALPQVTGRGVDLAAGFPQDAPTAAPGLDITVEEARTTAQTLARVTGVNPKGVSPTTTSPSAKPTQPSTGGRRSRAAVLRQARAAQQQQPAAAPTVTDEVAAAISRYRPSA